ncbi:MAG: thermonuclease family protein [Pseudomonadota bacterium]
MTRSVAVRRETVVASAVLEGAILTGKCWVIDGDTITIQGRKIRLAGIDAPELDHPFGRVAKATLMRLCRGQDVRAEFSGALSYERGVATCFLPDGRDLSAEMVKAGLALDWPKHSRGKYRSLEPADARRKLWRCDARQKGRMPPTGTRPNRPQPPPA